VQFSCQGLSAFSKCQEIDFLSGKRRNFASPAIQSLRAGEMSCFPGSEIVYKTALFLLNGIIPAALS
jgi:hypothetical protein